MFVEPPSVDMCCPVPRMLTLTIVGNVDMSSLPRPRAWTSVVRDASVKLFEVDMLLILQARSDMLGEGNLCI